VKPFAVTCRIFFLRATTPTLLPVRIALCSHRQVPCVWPRSHVRAKVFETVITIEAAGAIFLTFPIAAK
jgi:hypothetical protein